MKYNLRIINYIIQTVIIPSKKNFSLIRYLGDYYIFIILLILDLAISKDSNEEGFNKFNKLFLIFYCWKLNQPYKIR